MPFAKPNPFGLNKNFHNVCLITLFVRTCASQSYIQVPDTSKGHSSTFLGTYVASQSVWSNGYPVYFQVQRPNQKDRFAVEFHMRPSSPVDMSATTPLAHVGVWELKCKDKVGTSDCVLNFNTECDSLQWTLAPVTLQGALLCFAAVFVILSCG